MPPSELGWVAPGEGGRLCGIEVTAHQGSGSGRSAWTHLPEASSSRLSHMVVCAANPAPLGSFV